MLSVENNELLTRTGSGTPMGQLLRRYWVPALLSEEVAEPQCAPVRLTLMGESLVVFRTADGRLGALEEHCAHRQASLYYGRNESEESRDGQCGLRCVYHGWKYGIDGRCIDMPNEPATSKFKEHIRIRSYPVAERGDMIWIYLGPSRDIPALPDLEWAVIPETHRYLSKRLQRSNFAQAMEGGIDSSHVSFLHSDARLWNPDWTHAKDSTRDHLTDDGSPKFFVEPTDYGMLIGARRNAVDGQYYWRITQWLMPWYNLVARDGDGPITAHAWVPIDDENCWAFSITYNPDKALTKEQTDHYRHGGSVHAQVLADGSYLPTRNSDNDYLIDRTLQKTVSFTGIRGIAIQDVAMQESMGRVVDRTKEHLGSSDAAVIAARKRLLAEARALAEDATVAPSGLDPASQRVRSASAILPRDVSWVDATAESRQAAQRHYQPS
ncbi:Rieske 2Fe-2S domain-containing protein [Nocardia jiangxiensis]|uniref:Rieske 2Fe-2S domain-containing protein n=1 Tax=Nocardia jiangxiensis TaxID=282685 RepID=A0ABW6SCC0_9NOCA|nr:Rieske 2Fe-2S domain-containing protein [Nocardia jiangxiensis]